MSTRVIIFLEILGLIGAVAFFSGVHNRHLDQLQSQLAVIQTQTEASLEALRQLESVKEEVGNARIELDRRMSDACDLSGVLRYEYYDRLLREDAARRRGIDSASGIDGSVH